MLSTRQRPLALILIATAITYVLLFLTACGGSAGSAAGEETKELRYQGAANNVSLAELAADLGYFGDIKLKWVGNTISGPQDIQSAATGQTDFGGAFSGAVAKLITSGVKVKAVINYYGTDALTYQGFWAKASSPIKGPRDFIGKKVGVNTVGAHAEAVIDAWLEKGGLTKDEIKQVQLVVIPPVNAEQALRQGQIDVAQLGGVLQDHAEATGGLKKVFSDVELFGPFDGGQYVLTEAFIKKNPTTARTFVQGVAKAIEWERTTPREQVIARFTEIINKRGRNENTDNLKFWKSVGIPSKGGLIEDDDFAKWDSWLQAAGITKGPLDAKSLYTNEFNPFAETG